MSLNPSFRQLFPGSMLLACVDGDTSCSVLCKCAMVIGWWHRMEWPVAFLRRVPAGLTGARQHQGRVFSGAGDLVIDVEDMCPWRNHHLRDLLTDFGAASVTLAGSGLHDLLLGAVHAADAENIPAIIVADAVQGQGPGNLQDGRSEEAILSLLEPIALLLPMTAFMSTIEMAA
ncbi:hypothetical protein SAMN05444161_7387 [Rhizobiales bacterium GAS191]|jgi:hypothetical protein|nr:hypothetical protein SAMN05519103_06732 [Rhizobiales bacterium GAS113]SED67416.1 hypothetical protein SAMN05519104_4061 [Rhizobiales bacterium GAS188]SEE83932.1 hypothetical protein SAMN05444161_7387 [Rhizobiales bacterium GAS191]